MPSESSSSIPGQYAGPVIGVVFIIGTFALLSMVLLGHTKIEWKDIALVIVGSLLNQCSVILGKWFTASQSSDRKTELMAETAKTAVAESAKVIAAVEAKPKPVDPVGEAHQYKEQTAATVVKAEMAAENAVDNVKDLTEEGKK